MKIKSRVSTRKKTASLIFVFLMIMSLYPALILGYTWFHVANAQFPGGRNGPLDAYRHTLASALVAYTLDKRVVNSVSTVMEFQNSRSNLMDKHNNDIGANIGMRAVRFSDIQPAVMNAVNQGTNNAKSPSQVTWLTSEYWKESTLW
jgi:hypothetical protein